MADWPPVARTAVRDSADVSVSAAMDGSDGQAPAAHLRFPDHDEPAAEHGFLRLDMPSGYWRFAGPDRQCGLAGRCY